MNDHPATYRGVWCSGRFSRRAQFIQVFQPPVARDCTVKKTNFSKLKVGVAPIVLGVALISAPAVAQDVQADEEAAPRRRGRGPSSSSRSRHLESPPVRTTSTGRCRGARPGGARPGTGAVERPWLMRFFGSLSPISGCPGFTPRCFGRYFGCPVSDRRQAAQSFL